MTSRPGNTIHKAEACLTCLISRIVHPTVEQGQWVTHRSGYVIAEGDYVTIQEVKRDPTMAKYLKWY